MSDIDIIRKEKYFFKPADILVFPDNSSLYLSPSELNLFQECPLNSQYAKINKRKKMDAFLNY